MPAFRWYEKETGQVMVCNRPSSAAELERRAVARTGSRGLLREDGASRGNLFTGGAEQSALVMSVAARRGRLTRSRSGYFAYFSDPANAVRTAWSFAAEVGREVLEAWASRLRRDRPRVRRGGLYPLLRAFATVVERDVAVAAVVGDMLAGRAAVYADLVAYDEVAHHSGPRSRDARKVLARLDRSIRLIADTARYAPRPYRIVLLSDHGQSGGETFERAYGLDLRELVRAGCGLGHSGRRVRRRGGAEARTAARAALRRPERGRRSEEAECQGPPSEPVVLASGNLGLVSFPDIEGRATLEELERRCPELLETLTGHPGIGFVLVRSAERGAVVLGPRGSRELGSGRVVGADPLAPFGAGAAAAVARTDGFPHTADLMINSTVDPAHRGGARLRGAGGFPRRARRPADASVPALPRRPPAAPGAPHRCGIPAPALAHLARARLGAVPGRPAPGGERPGRHPGPPQRRLIPPGEPAVDGVPAGGGGDGGRESPRPGHSYALVP